MMNTFFEIFEQNIGIAIKNKADAIQIIAPLVDWQITPPIVGVTLVGDAGACIYLVNKIGTAASWGGASVVFSKV